MPYFDLSPLEYASLGNQRRQATSQYGLGRAQIDYQRSQAATANSQQMADLRRQYTQMREQLPGGFAQRGLLNSGLYARALKNYGTERQEATNRAAQGYQERLAGLDIEQRATETSYSDAMAALAAEEQARRAQIAATLRGIL